MSVRVRFCAIAFALACAPGAYADDVQPAGVAPPAASSSAGAPEPSAPQSASAPRTPAPGTRSASALQLEATQITGNRELPKVMVIVPWKSAEPGELAGRPINSLVEEVLTPIDRDVMRRTLDYYRLLAPGATPAADVKQAAEIDTTDQ